MTGEKYLDLDFSSPYPQGPYMASFTYIYHKFQPHVGKYIYHIYMDPTGINNALPSQHPRLFFVHVFDFAVHLRSGTAAACFSARIGAIQ